ncbi:AroM family protein [Microbacterium indicum]|uniref:AroM family protein n=1 Tax=Microbacterium indicum TaxID=358100 RepID=UPI0004097B5A|nr:AroM family protein [Microbacterium indicum]
MITIGQTPRIDLTPELEALLPGVELIERGVLDGCDDVEIAGFAPEPGDHVLTTRLADGGSAIIGERTVMERLPAIIARLEQETDAILLACTGAFPEMDSKKPFFVPDRIIAHAVAAAAPSGSRVGIVSPLAEQREDALRKFQGVLGEGREVLVAASSPYTGTEAELRAASRELAESGARLIALDCFGYTAAMRAAVADETGLPVVVARSVAARIAAEALGAGA